MEPISLDEPDINAKRDEKDLYSLMRKEDMQLRYAAERLGIPDRRAEYIAIKWSNKGFYNYGVVHDLGWFE